MGLNPKLSDTRRRTETARLLTLLPQCSGPTQRRCEEEIIRLNMPVANDVARRYHGRGIPAEDINQVAYLGLVKAVRGFDASVGEEFLSYAVPTVRGEIQRYFRDSGWAIRPPRSVQEVQGRFGAAEAELTQKLGRAPRPAEIAEYLEVSPALVMDALSANGCFSPASLDVPHVNERINAVESPLERMGDLDPAFASAEARLALRPLMSTLSERDRRILELRFFENKTQAEIGAVVGVTQEQVSRLLTGILARLRREIAA